MKKTIIDAITLTSKTAALSPHGENYRTLAGKQLPASRLTEKRKPEVLDIVAPRIVTVERQTKPAASPRIVTVNVTSPRAEKRKPEILNMVADQIDDDQINDEQYSDVTDKLTPAELQRLRLVIALERWGSDADRIRNQITPRRSKREAARYRCPFNRADADELRSHAETLIALADTIESQIADQSAPKRGAR
jgi:hypothetical protein